MCSPLDQGQYRRALSNPGGDFWQSLSRANPLSTVRHHPCLRCWCHLCPGSRRLLRFCLFLLAQSRFAEAVSRSLPDLHRQVSPLHHQIGYNSPWCLGFPVLRLYSYRRIDHFVTPMQDGNRLPSFNEESDQFSSIHMDQSLQHNNLRPPDSVTNE